MCFGMVPTRWAIVITCIFWVIFLIPQLWLYKINEYDMENNTSLYIIDIDTFNSSRTRNNTFTYLWAVLGYLIPVVVLAFCNVCLIRALHKSRMLRENVARVSSRVGSSSSRSSNRITLTLIVLVLMFIFLVSPSEIAHFYLYVKPDSFPTLEIAIIITNLLQVINFAFTFVLYSAVNVTFRRAFLHMCLLCC